MESTEIIANHEEYTKRRFRVFDLRQKFRSQAEGQGDLGRLVEVSLQDMPRQESDCE